LQRHTGKVNAANNIKNTIPHITVMSHWLEYLPDYDRIMFEQIIPNNQLY